MATIASDSAPPASPLVADDRVPVKTKVVYGAAGCVIIFQNHLPKNLANPIFVVALGIAPSWVSLAMLAFRLYDAFLDPLVGWLSDNTRSRWGRRRPYMFVGAILTGLCLPVMWLVSPEWTTAQQIAWFIGAGILLYSSSSIFAMPYESLNLELTPSYHERTSITSYKAFFQKIAFVGVGWAWFITQLPIFKDSVTGKLDSIAGARALTAVAGAIAIIAGILGAVYVKERFYKIAAAQPKIGFWTSFKLTFRSRAFVLIALITLCFASAYYLSMSMTFYLRLYYVTGGDQAMSAKVAGVEATLTMILGIASIPVFAWMARRIGKTWTLMAAMALTLVALACKWWTYIPGHPWLSMTSTILLAPSLTGIWQIIPSMTGDISDEDELRTGERREGAFASIYSWVANLSFTLGLTMAGPLVDACGFQVALAAQQADETILAMRIIDAAIPTVLLGVGMLLLCRYPLSPQRMTAIRQQLETRRGYV